MRRSKRCQHTRVIVASTADLNRPLLTELGVNAFFRKPASYREFLTLSTIIKQVFKT